jgi:hypothetical protein
VISPDIAVFTTHPTRPFSESDLLGESPGYWVGSGRLPHSAQMRNVVMTIYRLPAGPALMEKEMKGFTHAFFPRKYFDEAVLEGRCLLGRYGGAFIALIGKSDLRFAEGSDEEVTQDGGETYWICEMGSGEEDGSFEGFRERVKAQTVGYADGALVYETRGGEYRLVYGDGLYVNGERLSTDYARIDAPYCTLNRGQGALDVEFNGERLYLDFEKRVRITE